MITINNLSFGYNGGHLFDSLNLSLEAGNIYGLLGKNGAGKTSLLRIISGQLYHSKGECSVFDENPGNRSPQFLSNIFFLPEEFYMPVMKGTDYEKLYSPFYPDFNKEMFYEFLDEFDVDASKKLSALSHGQKKKYQLAFGMASQCKLFIMDEPTNGLDIPSKSIFRRLVASSITEDRTFVISTHQVRDLENIIDPIVILDSGKILFNNSMEDIASKLHLSVQNEEPKGEDVLYYEKVLGGYSVLQVNKENEESNINLEALFNATLMAHDKIEELFRRRG